MWVFVIESTERDSMEKGGLRKRLWRENWGKQSRITARILRKARNTTLDKIRAIRKAKIYKRGKRKEVEEVVDGVEGSIYRTKSTK